MNHVSLSFLFLLGSAIIATALPHSLPRQLSERTRDAPEAAGLSRGFTLPLKRTVPKERRGLDRRGVYSGNTGLGDFLDLCVFHASSPLRRYRICSFPVFTPCLSRSVIPLRPLTLVRRHGSSTGASISSRWFSYRYGL